MRSLDFTAHEPVLATVHAVDGQLAPRVRAHLSATLGRQWLTLVNLERASVGREPFALADDALAALTLTRDNTPLVAALFTDAATASEAAAALLNATERNDPGRAVSGARRLLAALTDPPPPATWPTLDHPAGAPLAPAAAPAPAVEFLPSTSGSPLERASARPWVGVALVLVVFVMPVAIIGVNALSEALAGRISSSADEPQARQATDALRLVVASKAGLRHPATGRRLRVVFGDRPPSVSDVDVRLRGRAPAVACGRIRVPGDRMRVCAASVNGAPRAWWTLTAGGHRDTRPARRFCAGPAARAFCPAAARRT